MEIRLAIVVASLVLPAAAMARPEVDPLRPPADAQPKAPTAAQRASARAHYARAMKLYKQKKYEPTLEELRLALKAAPDPDLHYSIAVVDIELDRCEDAISELQTFLETPHGPNATAAAKSSIETCKAKIAPPPPPPPPPAPKPVPIAAGPAHWYGDRLVDGLVAGGAVSGIIGLFCYRSAVSDLDAADASMTLADHARHVNDAHTMRTTSIVFGLAGVALVTAGVVRYVTHDRGHEPHSSVGMIPVAGGGLISFSGSFR